MIHSTLTHHASKRMQQRGIDELMLELVEIFGDRVAQDNGEYVLRIPKKKTCQLQAAVQKLGKIKIAYTGTHIVKTVMYDTQPTKQKVRGRRARNRQCKRYPHELQNGRKQL